MQATRGCRVRAPTAPSSSHTATTGPWPRWGRWPAPTGVTWLGTVNEVTDACCMCHIFACLSSVGIVSMCHTFACLGYSRCFILKVLQPSISFRSAFVGSILAHSSICELPLSGLSICISDLDNFSLINLCTTFKRACDLCSWSWQLLTR
jgi:hypothetical protein